MTESESSSRSRIFPYLQLMRLSALPTAMADIFLGFLLVHSSFQPALDFGLLLFSSSCLYLSGMLFNDVFDRKIDARERPGRPIPSGRVSLLSAVRLGIMLIAGGVGAAAVVGKSSLIVAVLIVGAIFAYDWLLKSTSMGPIAMGSCRFLNVMLGASTAEELWIAPQLGIALALGVYIIGVTWFARCEANTSRRSRFQAMTGIVFVNVGVMLLASFVATEKGEGDPQSVLILLAVVALIINRRLFDAFFDPLPAKIGMSIKTMLLSLPIIDAGLVLLATGRVEYALAVAALLIPALLLSRWMSVT